MYLDVRSLLKTGFRLITVSARTNLHGKRTGSEDSWKLLKIISENYSGRALGPEDLMRDANIA